MQKTLGVVVGRFQAPELHDGYRYLLDFVQARCESLMIVVGVTGGWSSERDPLDFAVRSVMLRTAYPRAVIVPITDNSSDVVWSNKLDTLIEKSFPEHFVTLFGSRDCFLPYYKGRHRIAKIEAELSMSSTLLRMRAASSVIDSREFRAGMIYAATTQNFPASFQAVDIAIRHSLEPKVLVGRKCGDEGWRFPGGFVDPRDQNLEQTARREALEEVGDIEISKPSYITSARIDDKRYRQSQHKVMSALYSAVYVFGHIKAGDDLDEVKWVGFDELLNSLIEEHKPLGKAFLESISIQKGA